MKKEGDRNRGKTRGNGREGGHRCCVKVGSLANMCSPYYEISMYQNLPTTTTLLFFFTALRSGFLGQIGILMVVFHFGQWWGSEWQPC